MGEASANMGKISEPKRSAAVLAIFAGLFIGLAVSGYRQKSATWDEPQHLTAGYVQLAAGDYRVDPEHPPLLRMWAALPLLASRGIELDRGGLGSDQWGTWLRVGQLSYCHRFCYLDNDADRMLYAARFMIVLLGVLLGTLVYLWAHELFGFWTATAVLSFFLLEPNCLAHAQLVTTDLGLTCFVFGAVYFAWRAARRITAGNLVGLCLFCCLAVVSKFTALLLGPLLLALFLIRAVRPSPWRYGCKGELGTRRARLAAGLAVLLGLGLAAYVTAWAAYGFRYAPAAGEIDEVSFRTEEFERQALPGLATLVDWSNDHRLLPNALTEGFLLGQVKALSRAEYFAGQFRQTGWWYYFPAAFLIKTPISVIMLFLAGLVISLFRTGARARDQVFICLPIAVFLGAAMFARLNIGLRHVLPIYPFVLLTGGWALRKLRGKRGMVVLGLIGALAIFEFGSVSPNYLAFFNLSVGGPRGGDRWLIDSNLDWGQDLKGLKRWMVQHHVEHVNLSYFGTADPEYYGIDCTYLPGSLFFRKDRIGPPEYPGYIAVSVTNLRIPHSSEALRAMCKALQQRQPVAVIGHSINVYQVNTPQW